MARREREGWNEGGQEEIRKKESEYRQMREGGYRQRDEKQRCLKKKANEVVWKRDIITLTLIFKLSISHLQWKETDQRTQKEWRTATCPEWKGEKNDQNTFSFVSSFSSPGFASKISITLLWEMSGVFPSLFLLFPSSPLHLFWSCLPLWEVVIGRAVYLLSAGLRAFTFEMLSLCSLNRCWQTWNQQTRGEKGEKFKRNMIDVWAKCLNYWRLHGLLYTDIRAWSDTCKVRLIKHS